MLSYRTIVSIAANQALTRSQMSSDYEYSDEDADYYDDDEDMIDGTQEDGQSCRLSQPVRRAHRSIGSASDEEVDMDAFNEDFKVTTKATRKSYEIPYESLTQAAIEKVMQADIEHISGIFGVDVSQMIPVYMVHSQRETFNAYRPVWQLCCCAI